MSGCELLWLDSVVVGWDVDVSGVLVSGVDVVVSGTLVSGAEVEVSGTVVVGASVVAGTLTLVDVASGIVLVVAV